MCGITGIVNLDGRPVERKAVERMTRTLSHRGPDAEGSWVEGAVGFGHRRLTIRDLSDRGGQPLFGRLRNVSGKALHHRRNRHGMYPPPFTWIAWPVM